LLKGYFSQHKGYVTHILVKSPAFGNGINKNHLFSPPYMVQWTPLLHSAWNAPMWGLEYTYAGPGMHLCWVWNTPMRGLEYTYAGPGMHLCSAWNIPMQGLECTYAGLGVYLMQARRTTPPPSPIPLTQFYERF